MLSLETLIKIATAGGFIIAGTGYTLRFLIQNNIRESEIYKEALKCFYEHKKSVELLGAPVREGRVDISDTEAFGFNDKSKWVTIPLQGSLRKGNLHVQMLLSEQSENLKKYNISKIELKVNDMPNKIFVIKDNSNL